MFKFLKSVLFGCYYIKPYIFATFKQRSYNQRHIFSGKSGGWRTDLTADQISRIQEWENKYLQQTDLRFQYD